MKATLRTIFMLLVSSFIFSFSSGCTTPPDNSGPDEAARRFVAALEARDTSAIISLLEPSDWRAEIGPELRSSLAMLSALELREPTYTVSNNNGTSAQVRITGTLAYTRAETSHSGSIPVDLHIDTVRVGSAWYLHSLELPQPTEQ